MHTDMCRVKNALLELTVDLTPSTTRFCLTSKNVELVIYQVDDLGLQISFINLSIVNLKFL